MGNCRSAIGRKIGWLTLWLCVTPAALSMPLVTTFATSWTPFSPTLLRTFYATHGHQCWWTPARAQALLQLVWASADDGFNPAAFHADQIAQVLLSEALTVWPSQQRAEAELLLTDALARYLHHYRYGQYNPQRLYPNHAVRPAADTAVLLADMAGSLLVPDMTAWLPTHLPHPPFYTQLLHAYHRYRAAVNRGLAIIPAGASLAPGQYDPRLPTIRARLAVIENVTAAPPANATHYDSVLLPLIQQFQRRRGLPADGVIGARTIAALNAPLAQQLALIAVNLERMRWFYHALPSDFIFVDITQFQLQLVRQQRVVWRTAVMVGAPETPTPMLRDDLEYIVFNPTWVVPPSIQRELKTVTTPPYQVIDRRTGKPVKQRDVTNTERYQVVQLPGDKNALGRVKFVFPNHLAVYLHDTPAKPLFQQPRRAVSHGCIRVQHPLVLAQHLLHAAPRWNTTYIAQVIERGDTRHVTLPQPLPVVLYYLTALADSAGRVIWRPDIYHYDNVLLTAITQPAPRPRLTALTVIPAPH